MRLHQHPKAPHRSRFFRSFPFTAQPHASSDRVHQRAADAPWHARPGQGRPIRRAGRSASIAATARRQWPGRPGTTRFLQRSAVAFHPAGLLCVDRLLHPARHAGNGESECIPVSARSAVKTFSGISASARETGHSDGSESLSTLRCHSAAPFRAVILTSLCGISYSSTLLPTPTAGYPHRDRTFVDGCS